MDQGEKGERVMKDTLIKKKLSEAILFTGHTYPYWGVQIKIKCITHYVLPKQHSIMGPSCPSGPNWGPHGMLLGYSQSHAFGSFGIALY